MKLKDWIEKEGQRTIAYALGVDESTVRHWRTGWVLPGDALKLKIQTLSRGAVSVEGMIRDHYAPENKKNRYAK